MVTELSFEINGLQHVMSDEFMQIDIRPENQLIPVPNLPADQQPALVYLASLGESSQRTMWDALMLVAGVLTAGQCNPVTLPWWTLLRQHVNAVRAWLIDHRSVATGQRVMVALRGTLKECWRLELISVDDYMKAVDVKAIRGEKPSQAAGRALNAGEKAAIIRVCRADPSPAGPRDAAIFGLGVFGGLRRAEIAGLDLDDYDQANQVLTVKGKGNKTRTVHIAGGVDDTPADWLHVRPSTSFPSTGSGTRSGGFDRLTRRTPLSGRQ